MSEEEKVGLDRNSTIDEVFNHIAVTEGANVIPVTVKQKPHDTRIMVLIQGQHDIASVIMAEIMTLLQDMSDTVKQQEQNDGGPSIVLPGS